MAWNAFDGLPVLVERKAPGPQSHSLIKFHMIANDTRRTDDDTCTVVDCEMRTDCRGWMDVDARL